MKFYTYIHRTADDGRIFYVGKGSGNRAWKPFDRSDWWHKTAKKHGFEVEICAQWKTENEAFEHEKFLILCFNDLGFRLVNLTAGGDGPSGYRHTNESKELMSRRTKEFWSKEENIQRMKLIRQNQWSTESRTKSSIAQQKRWTEEEKIKHSLILIAAYSSEERKKMQREKSPLVNNGRVYEEKKQAAIRNYWLSEQAMSEEAKKKRSEARKIGWETRRKNAHN